MGMETHARASRPDRAVQAQAYDQVVKAFSHLAGTPAMKLIGLLGGRGLGSHCHYYRMINEYTPKQLGEQHTARILLHSRLHAIVPQQRGRSERGVTLLGQRPAEPEERRGGFHRRGQQCHASIRRPDRQASGSICCTYPTRPARRSAMPAIKGRAAGTRVPRWRGISIRAAVRALRRRSSRRTPTNGSTSTEIIFDELYGTACIR
jgi:hypothetical protein